MMRDQFMKALMELAKEDSNLMLLTGDLGYGVFEDFENTFGKRQYLNVGVAEQNLTGVAAGLALEGKRVFTYSIGNFPTMRCLEQIRNDLAYHDLNVTVVGSGGGFSYGALGMSHHATEDLSIMRSLPGVEVIAPCSGTEMYHATRAIVERSGVGYLRIDKTTVIGDEEIDFNFSKVRVLRQGQDVVIFAIGGIVSEALKAADILQFKNISARVVSVHTLKPLNQESILNHMKEVPNIITLEENTIYGGLGSALAEICVANNVAINSFNSIGLKDVYSSVVGSQQYLRAYYGMDAETIVKTACKIRQ
jgi:transketolase